MADRYQMENAALWVVGAMGSLIQHLDIGKPITSWVGHPRGRDALATLTYQSYEDGKIHDTEAGAAKLRALVKACGEGWEYLLEQRAFRMLEAFESKGGGRR